MITIAVYRPESATLQKMIVDFRDLEATRVVSGVGAISFTLAESQVTDFPLQADTRMALILSDDSYSHLFGTYLLGGWVWQTIGHERYVTLNGLCLNSLLMRRIIAYAAGSAQAKKSDAADNIMRAVVRENLGSLASSDRDISAYGFSVEADLSLAQSVSMAFAWRKVIDVLVDIARAAYQQNAEQLYWDIVPGSDGWSGTFQVRKSFFRDRRMSSSSALWLSPDNGTIDEIVESYDRRDTYNYVYAGGQGNGAGRVIVSLSDGGDISQSVIARAENFYDGSQYGKKSDLTAAARKHLRAGKPKTTVEAKLNDGYLIRYGRDIAVGDAVTVKGRAEYDMILRAVRLSSSDGVTTFETTLEAI
jgi:hypothetical protein